MLKRRVIRIAGIAALLVLASGAVLHWAPWRAHGPPDDHGRTLAYLERIVGAGADDVAAHTPLPMLVDAHPHGALPELHGSDWSELSTPVRLIVPVGPHRTPFGRSWFTGDNARRVGEIRDVAERLSALVEHLSETRPTRGTPIVTGFSQGGVMSFMLAAHHPDSVAAAFPVGGWLLPELVPESAPADPPPVLAFQGSEDAAALCRFVVQSMGTLGWDAEARIYPGVVHEPSAEMRAHRLEAVERVLGP